MSAKTTIGLISATEAESRIVIRHLRKNRLGNFYSGRIKDRKIVLALSGIGKTNASHAATLLIEKFSPSLIINFGIGGAYPSSGLRPGDIAVADEEIYGDEGLLLDDGFYTVDSIGIPFLVKTGKKYFNRLHLDKKLIAKALRSYKLTYRNIHLTHKIKSGKFVTLSVVTGTDKRARELEKRFNGICENMEGAAVAHICAIYGLPVLEIRGISNIVERRDREKWDIVSASENCQNMVLNILCSL